MNNSMQGSLAGKVAVVTGGSGVLGAGFCETLAAAGAAVAVLSRREEACQVVAQHIVDNGGTALAVAADVLERTSLTRAAREIEDRLGPCDILINAAGGNHPRATTRLEFCDLDGLEQAGEGNTFFDLDPADIDFVLDLNLKGTLLASQVFGRAMAGRGGGTIINISSLAAGRPLTKVVAYAAAKAAVENFTRWLAVHLAVRGVRVNAIAPGFFLAEQNRALLLHPDGSLTPRAEKILAHTPLGRFGAPADLAGTLLWLADDRCSGFVSGITVAVDGGFSAYAGV